ncbi:histidine kinase [Leptolyngbya sp. 'hensonii']|uniref:histidine kinase n=1 Tax=Leptolyngbya sp. 'hensonii' TaxID=1922337 RepID=UPI0009501A74|nr:histidine kinase [Leptolyngbya sp. 'hensonii']OLP19257.1 histidine kinase [Leptolyngbya sp. 'hensonii']
MNTSCHIIVEGNPAIIFASRNGSPARVMPVLEPFLEKFWQERDSSGETHDTPECLVAQIIVRFGFESCEDDFSNLKVGVGFKAKADYLYWIGEDRSLTVWVPDIEYRGNPKSGLGGCRLWTKDAIVDRNLVSSCAYPRESNHP